MISIREFQDGDADAAAVVYYESFKTYLKERAVNRPAEYWLGFMKHFKSDDFDNISFVAVDGEKVVGCITITCGLKRGLGSIQRVGVLPEYAKKGVGKMLFEQANKFLKERKMRKITVSVSSINPVAIKYYERCGFYREAVLKEHYHAGVDEYIMALFY